MVRILQDIFKQITADPVDKGGVRTRRCKECGTKIEYNEHVKYCPGYYIFNFLRR